MEGLVNGRIVHYVSHRDNLGTHLAAMIVNVVDPAQNVVDLCVFPRAWDWPRGAPEVVVGVRYSAEDEPKTWHFVERN